jgi:hypothetical protein
MPNGKSGDAPFTDIIVHGHDVYSPLIASLVREIDGMADKHIRKELSDLLWQGGWNNEEQIARLESVLTRMRDDLLQATKAKKG